MVNREEIDAMWERIKALEGNSLELSKALATQSIISIFAQMYAWSIGGGKHKTFLAYMKPKATAASEQLNNAQNVDEVIKIIDKFVDDCLNFTGALFQ